MHLFEAFRFQALGTQVLVCSPVANSLAREVRAIVDDCEAQFSRFRPSSDVERLSAQAGKEALVTDDLFEVLELSADFWRETGAIFDPLVRPELERAGYDRTFEQIPADSDEQVGPPREIRPTFGNVRLDPDRRAVRLPDGCALDLGGIAKGWLVDRLIAKLEPYGPCLVDIGGDIAVRGDGPDGGNGWLLAVADPDELNGDRCWIRLEGRAIATSTTLRRRWRRGGRWQHHLIDPRTGRSSESDLVQVTVVASTAARADVFAKTVVVLGRTEGLAWLNRKGLPGLLIGPTRSTCTFAWQDLIGDGKALVAAKETRGG